MMAVQELTVQEMMLTSLMRARAGLKQKNIDEIEMLFNDCRRYPRELWPPEVARFVDRHKCQHGPLRFKRPRGRMRSARTTRKRFSRDPNRIAAELAALFVIELRSSRRKPKRFGPYKVRSADGLMPRNVHSEAVRRAVAIVKKANPAMVKELLRKGRGMPNSTKRRDLSGDHF